MRRIFRGLVVTLLFVSPSFAQVPSPQAGPSPLPYEADLLRLAEVMGGMHYLTRLCDGDGASVWRDQMTALITAEQPDEQRRLQLTDRFNHGYEGYRAVYRSCTDEARLALARYQDEGFGLAATIEERYGAEDGE